LTDGFTIVRRGVASTAANWPLILAQLVELVVMMVVLIGGIFLAIVMLGLSIDWDAVGSFGSKGSDPEAFVEGIAEWFLANLGAVAWLFVAVCLICGVAVLIHSYFHAGVTGIFVEYERRGETWGWREAWRRFDFSRFVDYAVRRGWRVFWVYNVVWGVAGLFLLIPLVVVLGIVLLIGENAAAIVVACCGIALVVVAGVLVAIVAGAWAQVAITIGIATDRGAVAASSAAGDFIRGRLGPVLIVVLVFFAASIGVSTVTSTMGMAFDAAGMLPGGDLFALPLRISFSFVSFLASSIIGLWLASCFAIMVLEGSPAHQGGKRAE
jgi:hypothetical protein